jgi:RNA polymerase sigma factor (sigma-70 family)
LRGPVERNALVLQWLPLVHWVVKRLYRPEIYGSSCPVTHEDAIQAGMLGLIRAAELYDSRRGTQFNTYAVRWIEQSIRRALDECPLIRVSTGTQQAMRRLRRGQPEHRTKYLEAGQRALDCRALPDDDYVTPSRKPPDEPEEHGRLRKALAKLYPAERRLLELRFGFRGEPQSFRQLAPRMGVSYERVRQRQEAALARLRRYLGLPEVEA